MKIVCISDTHFTDQFLNNIPDGDVIVHAGDATFKGQFAEVVRFNAWYSSLPHKHKIFVAGNHELSFEDTPWMVKPLLSRNITYLQNSGVEIDGIKFWGSPYQPEFHNWAFNLPRGEIIKKVWDQIPEGTDVLITHGPPHGILDIVKSRANELLGCEELLKAVLRIKPRLHVFGHIHDSYGITHKDGIKFVNASSCTEQYYGPRNAPIVVEL